MRQISNSSQNLVGDVEKGIQAVSDLRAEVVDKLRDLAQDDGKMLHVQEELKDQQDAMNHMMDMIDKSSTVEVRTCV